MSPLPDAATPDASPPPNARDGRMLAAGGLLVALVAAASLVVALPFGEGPDERSHAGYAGFIAREGREPRPPADDVFQAAQHPPFAYALLAGFQRLVGGAFEEADPAREVVVPGFLRRVVLRPGRRVPDPSQGPLSGAAPSAATPRIPEGRTYLWRVPGLVLLVVTGFAVVRALGGAVGGATAAIALAAPPFALAFATVNNDGVAACLATLGFAAAAAPVARGEPFAPRRLLAAGLLLGLGLATKLTTLGVVVAAAVVVLFGAPRPARRRLADVALLTALPALLGGWWIVRQAATMDAVVEYFATRHPGILRASFSDALGLADLGGVLAFSWLGFAGDPSGNPGFTYLLAGAALPLVAVGGGLAVLRDRAAPRAERVLCGAFLAGLAAQFALLLVGNGLLVQATGRYASAFVLPGALAFRCGLRRLCGARAGGVAVVLACAVAGGTALLVHGRVVPRHHPPFDRYADPNLVAYVDCGAPWADAATVAGVPWRDGGVFSDRPETTALVDGDAVRVRVGGLDPAGAYSVRLRVRARAVEASAEDFFVDDLPLAGALTALGREDWLEVPVPQAASSDGAIVVAARRLQGEPASLAEVQVLRAPVTARSDAAGGVVVELRAGAPKAGWTIADSRGGEPEPLAFDDGGAARPKVRPTPDADGRRSVVIARADVPWSDVKAAAIRAPGTPPAAARGAPGYLAVRVDGATGDERAALAFPLDLLPPGNYRVVFAAPEGTPIGPGVLVLDDGTGVRREAASARLVVDARTPKGAEVRVFGARGATAVVDRVRLLKDLGWTFAVAP